MINEGDKIYATYIKSLELEIDFENTLAENPVTKASIAEALINNHQDIIKGHFGCYPSHELKSSFAGLYPRRWVQREDSLIPDLQVIEWVGDLADFYKEGTILFTDSYSFMKELGDLRDRYDFRVCAPYCAMDGTSHLVMGTPVRNSDGTTALKISRLFMDRKYLVQWAVGISDICLWKDNGIYDGVKDTPDSILSQKVLLAIPGNAGTFTNKLIKKGWGLCDCGSDIVWAVKKAKEKKEKGEK